MSDDKVTVTRQARVEIAEDFEVIVAEHSESVELELGCEGDSTSMMLSPAEARAVARELDRAAYAVEAANR